MKTRETTPGKTYAVTSPNGCTVTTDDGLTLAEIEAGKQGYFVAVSGKVLLSDEAAVLTQVFKLAPQHRLALLGVLGGNDGLPAGYKRVEYLESTGTQYIMTGFFPDDSAAIELDVNPLHAPEGLAIWLFANADADKTEAGRLFKAAANYKTLYLEYGSFRTGEGSYIYDNPLSPDWGTRRIIVLQNGLCQTGLTNFKFPTQIFKDELVELSIFRNIRDQTVTMLDIYSCILTRNGKIERHFIPACDPTGAPCMFDLVSRKPFYNQGAGDFRYPTESTTYSLRRTLPDWGKITEHGLRRLYHAPANYQGELVDYALENGYKPIIAPEKPAEGYWSPQWRETEDEIVLEWVETEPPMEDFGLPMPEETT